MATAGKEEALLLNDSQGKKQPEVFGSIWTDFVSNHIHILGHLALLSLSLFPSTNLTETKFRHGTTLR